MASPIRVHFYRSEARRLAVLARRYRFMRRDLKKAAGLARRAVVAMTLCQTEIQELASEPKSRDVG